MNKLMESTLTNVIFVITPEKQKQISKYMDIYMFSNASSEDEDDGINPTSLMDNVQGTVDPR